MFASAKTVKLGDISVVCKDFTYGYILGIENGTIEDTVLNAVENGTDLSNEQILNLRKHEVDELYDTILKLTYPQLYNEDGTMKNIEASTDDDKKKV